MSRTMLRAVMAGALALAAVGAVEGAGASALAAPQVNPFAGTYSGLVPGSDSGTAWEIVIDPKGNVADHEWGSFGRKGGGGSADVGGGGDILELEGRVSKSGEMTIKGRERLDLGWFGYVYNDFTFSAIVALDSAGDLHGVTTDGTPIHWFRE